MDNKKINLNFSFIIQLLHIQIFRPNYFGQSPFSPVDT